MSKQEKDKLRVYEYAKNSNMSSKEIITILKRVNIPVNNHMSVMEDHMVTAVEGFFRDIKANAAAKRASENSTQASVKPAEAKPSVKDNPKPQAEAKPANEQRRQEQQSGERNDMQTRTNDKPADADQKNQQSPRTGDNRGQGQSGQGGYNRDNRGQGQGGQGSYNRGPGQGQSGQGGNNRGPGQGQGGQGGYNRGPGQGQGGQGGYNRGPGQGQGGQGGFNRSPGQGQGARPQQAASSAAPATRQDDRRKRFDSNNNSGEGQGGRNSKNGPQKRFEDARGGGFRGKPGKGGKGGKGGRGGQEVRKEKPDNTPKKIIVRGPMSVGELAKLLHKDASEVIKKLLFMGVMATINQELDLDAIQLIADEYKVEVEIKIPVNEEKFEEVEEKDDEADLEERPPVVTIMGHVDHGKTTLLDAFRESRVALGEAGGITQHIGAYQVEINGKKITFLDTPGHEAFTTMRARGAQVTDITILVVAADDGVMPQTVEAIAHAKAAGVPIIVAVNKIDKPGADPDRIKQNMTEHGLVPEEWGGDTIFVNVSAKQRLNLDNLLEMILLVSEVEQYKANPNKRARGTVIEAELDKSRGPVARILIQNGTLKVGDAFVAGVCFGRVRAMVNDKGRRIKEAGPSTPIELTGLTEVPQAGDPFIVFEDERKAREIAEKRSITKRQSEVTANTRVTLNDLFSKIKEGEMKELGVIIKADVQGSVEALKGSLEKIEVEGVRIRIIHSGAGAITDSDIILASASNAIVIGFNVRPDAQAAATAEQEKVDVRLHRVIYNIIEEIEQAMKGMLEPVYKENVIGQAEVRNIFRVSKVGTIAGCMVTSGKIIRSAEVRVIRGGVIVFEGKLESLKRFKDDVREVAQGYECGISLEKFNDIKEGDIIEAFVMETVER